MQTIIEVAAEVSKKRTATGEIKNVKSYSDLARRMQGNRGKIIVDIALFIAQFSCCVGYLNFIAKEINQILCDQKNICDNENLYIYLLIIPSIPISLIKSYTYLSYVSMSGIFGAVLGGILLISYMGTEIS